MTRRHAEYRMGCYRVVEQIDDEPCADGTTGFRWRATAFDEAGRMPCDVQWTAPTPEEAERQLAFAVSRMRFTLTEQGEPLVSLLKSA
ncbi:MAG TPA: hypothetical protein VKZ50_07945 [bacterium]|nr:hypothetical protein [bacterium]